MKLWPRLAFVVLATTLSSAQTPAPDLTLPTIPDPPLNEYLMRLTDGINARLNPSMNSNVTVLASDTINAYALPNGDVYITRGMLNAVANEAEVVFVLAQQLAALQLTQTPSPRPTTHYSRQQPDAGHTILVGLASGALMAMGGPVGIELGLAIIAQEIGHRAVLSRSSWQTVPAQWMTGADRMAVEYLYEAGYDPEAAITVLEKLRAARPKGYVRQSELPPSPVTFAERIRLLRNRVNKLERKKEYLLDSSAFRKLKARLDEAHQPTTTEPSSAKPAPSSSR